MANNYVTVSSWGRTYHLDSWVCARWLDAKRSLGVLESRWSITSSPCWKPAHCLCCLCCLCWTLPTPHPHPHKRDKSARNCSTGSKSEKFKKWKKNSCHYYDMHKVKKCSKPTQEGQKCLKSAALDLKREKSHSFQIFSLRLYSFIHTSQPCKVTPRWPNKWLRTTHNQPNVLGFRNYS